MNTSPSPKYNLPNLKNSIRQKRRNPIAGMDESVDTGKSAKNNLPHNTGPSRAAMVRENSNALNRPDSEELKHSVRLQNIEFIHAMLKDLRKIAQSSREQTLIYYLDMAIMETAEITEVERYNCQIDYP